MLLLVLLGMICNQLLQFRWNEMRWTGVLQRIGICYGAAALTWLHTTTRQQIAICIAILLGYWAILAWVPVPGGVAGDLTMEGNLGGYLDRNYLPGKILPEYYGWGDNEGILSTIPAVVTALLGALCGTWLRTSQTGWNKFIGMATAGLAMLLLGTIWGQRFPVIKNLWTSSYVLVAAGWSLLLLSLFYLVIDVMQWRRWTTFFVVIGMNPVTIYVASEFIDFEKVSRFFAGGVISLAPEWAKVILIAGTLTAQWLFLWFLYRHRVFLRV
jgi:predicted acyltransferase